METSKVMDYTFSNALKTKALAVVSFYLVISYVHELKSKVLFKEAIIFG